MSVLGHPLVDDKVQNDRVTASFVYGLSDVSQHEQGNAPLENTGEGYGKDHKDNDTACNVDEAGVYGQKGYQQNERSFRSV